MPIFPAASSSSGGFSPPDTDVAFDKTLQNQGQAQELVAVPSGKVGRSFTLMNDGPGDAFIEFDGNATTNSTRVRPGYGYAESNVVFTDKISFVGENNKKPRVHGVIWCG